MEKFLSLIAMVLLLTSCGGLERKAKKQMKETMFELAKNPDTFKIIKVKTILANDSVCVLSFTTKGQNGFGGYSSSRYEYYYVRQKGKDKGEEKFLECVQNLEDNNPLEEVAEDFLKECHGNALKNKTKEEQHDAAMYLFALTRCVFNGREVEE